VSSRSDRDGLLRGFLTQVIVPCWSLAGAVDWIFHRRTKIEEHAGTHESLTHVLMANEGAIGILAAILFETDLAVVGLTFAAAALHEATVFWDVSYASERRDVSQLEQHTHAFMEVLPFVVALYATYLYVDKERTAKSGEAPSDRGWFRLNAEPLSAPSATGLIASMVLGVVPYVEEFVRCWRVHPTLAPLPVSGDRRP